MHTQTLELWQKPGLASAKRNQHVELANYLSDRMHSSSGVNEAGTREVEGGGMTRMFRAIVQKCAPLS